MEDAPLAIDARPQLGPARGGGGRLGQDDQVESGDAGGMGPKALAHDPLECIPSRGEGDLAPADGEAETAMGQAVGAREYGYALIAGARGVGEDVPELGRSQQPVVAREAGHADRCTGGRRSITASGDAVPSRAEP